jgi:hypothetical protein
LLGLIICLTACDDHSTLSKVANSEDVVVAKRYAEALRGNHSDYIVEHLHPSLSKRDAIASLTQAAALFPAADPLAVTLVGFSKKTIGNVAHIGTYFEYSYPSSWVLVRIAFDSQSSNIVLTTVAAAQLREPLLKSTALTFAHLSPVGLAAIGLALANLLFTVLTFAFTWRAPIPRWRILWRVFVLFGAGSIAIDTYSGAWASHLLHFAIPASNYTKEIYQPLVINLYLPLGAILYWVKRQRWRRNATLTSPDSAEITKIFD